MVNSCSIPSKYLRGWRECRYVKNPEGSINIDRTTGSVAFVEEVTQFIRKYNLTVTHQSNCISYEVITPDEAINIHNYDKRYVSMFDSTTPNRNDSKFSVSGDKEIIVLFKLTF